MKKKRLGRGLDSLIGNIEEVAGTDEVGDADGLVELDIDRIQRGRYQPRQVFEPEALQELADSIAAQGVVQPIVVRPEGKHFELVAGERRWRAAQLAGLQKVPAVIRELDAKSAAAIALIENIQREDLNPMEEARAIRRLIDEFDMTHQDAASAGLERALRTMIDYELDEDEPRAAQALVAELEEEDEALERRVQAALAAEAAEQSRL